MIPRATGEDSHPEDDRYYMDYVITCPKRDNISALHHIYPAFTESLDEVVPFLLAPAEGDRQAAEAKAKEWDLTLEPGRPMPSSYFWSIGPGDSLGSRPGEDVVGNYTYDDFTMELRSRVLAEDELYELHRVYRRLRAEFRINVNSTCAAHVHVGIGHLGLPGLQRLTTLVMFAESFLWRCCERHRARSGHCPSINTASEAAVSAMTRAAPPPGHPLLDALLPDNTPPNLRRIVAWVWGLHGVDDLAAQLLQHGGGRGRCAFSVRAGETSAGFTGARVAADRTAEFRYSHASGDPVRDEKFARICAALVRAASLEPAPFKATLESFMAGRSFVDFLRPLDLAADLNFWLRAEGEYIRKAANPGPLLHFLPELAELR